jgi:hypothetical protein
MMPLNWVDRVFFYNNTVYFPETVSYAPFIANISATSGTITFRNNILDLGATNNGASIFHADGMGTVVTDHNDLYAPAAGTLSAPNVGSGGILTDPQFVSTTVGAATAFRLKSGSGAVDSGTNTHVYQSLGNAPGRPQNSAWDMGAFELKNP